MSIGRLRCTVIQSFVMVLGTLATDRSFTIYGNTVICHGVDCSKCCGMISAQSMPVRIPRINSTSIIVRSPNIPVLLCFLLVCCLGFRALGIMIVVRPGLSCDRSGRLGTLRHSFFQSNNTAPRVENPTNLSLFLSLWSYSFEDLV